MRQLVDQAQADPEFVRFAIDLVRNVPAYDEFGEVSALFSFVQSAIRYTKDPVAKEKLYPPKELLKIRAGDCDDISMLLGALALALGYPARLITLGANPNYPNEFSHVYVEVEVPAGSGQWVALDAARPGSQFGLQPPMWTRKRAWSLTDDSYQDLKGATRLRGLGSYLGQDDSSGYTGVNYGPLISQSVSEIPQIIAAAQGAPTSRTAQGTVITGSPYTSFMTPYTPGYALPAAGYPTTLPALSGSLFSSALPWILAGVVALAVFRR
jgi:hypothetical protein